MPFIAFFLSPLGRYLGGAIVVLALLGGIYFKGHSDGYSSCKASWDAAEARTIKRGEDARGGAVGDQSRGVRDGFQRNDD